MGRDAARAEMLELVLALCRTGCAKRHDPETGQTVVHMLTPGEYARLLVQVWARLDEGTKAGDDDVREIVDRIIWRRGEGRK